MIRKPMHPISGEVKVRIQGKSPERFLNLCVARGLFLRKVSRKAEYCECVMTAEEFLSCRPMARKSRVQVHIQRKKGLPFLLFRFRRRIGFFLGVPLALSILFFCSTLLWEVELAGENRHTLDQFVTFLAESKVTPGVRMKDIVCGDLEEAVRNTYPDVLWVSIQKKGCRLAIQIRENPDWPPEETEETVQEISEETGVDLIAEQDGVIESIVTRQGIPMVAAGDSVVKGQVLVSGAIPVTDDAGTVVRSRLVHSDADIVAVTSADYHWRRERYLENVTHDSLCFLKATVEIGGQRVSLQGGFAPAAMTGEWHPFRLFSYFPLPISWQIQRGYRLQVFHRNLTEEEIKALCEEELQKYSESLQQKGVQILEKDVKITYGSFWLNMDGTMTLRGPMGTEAVTNLTGNQTEEKETE